MKFSKFENVFFDCVEDKEVQEQFRTSDDLLFVPKRFIRLLQDFDLETLKILLLVHDDLEKRLDFLTLYVAHAYFNGYGLSDDAWMDHRSWILFHGRDFFEAALTNPDNFYCNFVANRTPAPQTDRLEGVAYEIEVAIESKGGEPWQQRGDFFYNDKDRREDYPLITRHLLEREDAN